MISELSPPQSLQSTHDKPGCKKTLLSRIRQTFCSGSMREPTSASPRSQHEQPLPLCPWPAQQSQPSMATLAPREATLGWQKGHRDNPSTPIPIRHVFPTLGKALLGMFPYCPIPPLQLALTEVSPCQWLCSRVFLLCLVSRSSSSIQCHHHSRFPTLLINPYPKESSSSSAHRAL